MRPIEDRILRRLLGILARRYLRKPDLTDFLAIQYPDRRSVLAGLGNELFYRMGAKTGYRLTRLNVEVTNTCNLSCTICPVTSSMTREQGLLDFELFRAIVGRSPDVRVVQLYQWGEPLLHPRLTDMIRFTRAEGKEAWLTTNGTLLDEKAIGGILDAGLSRLTVSIDGTRATHEAIRGRVYDRVRNSFRRLREMRDAAGSPLRIQVSAVVNEMTEPVLDEFRREWRGLADYVQAIPMLERAPRRTRCREPWRGAMVVLWDGRAVPCCVDYDAKAPVGDVREQTPSEIWNGPAMRGLRVGILDGALREPCRTCSEYRSLAVSRRFG